MFRAESYVKDSMAETKNEEKVEEVEISVEDC
jgi:hypothetical protein